MARKPNAEALLRKHLGKEAADALLNKVDSMLNTSLANINKTISSEIAKHIKEKTTCDDIITRLDVVYLVPPKKSR